MDVSEPFLEDPDVKLMLRVRAGDRKSFERLFLNYSKPLMNFVRRFVGSQAVAEEVAQEVFLKVYRARGSYEPRSRFSTFLFRVATNHCLNELRRGEHRQKIEPFDRDLETEDGLLRSEIGDPGPGPEELVQAERLSRAVERAIGALPETQRAALLLLRYHGQSYEEIALALDLSVPAVKSLLNRAKTALRERLSPYLTEDPHELRRISRED